MRREELRQSAIQNQNYIQSIANNPNFNNNGQFQNI